MLSLLLAVCLVAPPEKDVFAADNLAAWCIVPFDANKRGPAERVAMLKQLGFRKYAYDWRAEHLPSFDDECRLLKEAGIELTAVWFPPTLTAEARTLLAAIEKHKLTPQLWVMFPEPKGPSDAAKADAAAKALVPVVDAAAKLNCRVSLYNHGGWPGEPANVLAVIEALNRPNVGIVYNLHHGHAHLPHFAELLKSMLPKLDVLNLNGMHLDGDKRGMKIDILGEGAEDLRLLTLIRKSGFAGPIGILGHTDDDAEARLADNLAGLAWLKPQLAGKPAGPKPLFRTKPLTVDADGIRIAPVSAVPKVVVTMAGRPEPISGAGSFKGNVYRWSPKYPWVPNVDYRIESVVDGKTLTKSYRVPVGPRASVLRIDPTAEQWPENILRIYLHFDAPMMRGDGLKHIVLTTTERKVVEDPFLDLDEELWSIDGRRLTTFFDPARVKRGLKPREDVGNSLTAGVRYHLTVRGTWPDAAGRPLAAGFVKTFAVVAADYEPIDPMRWTVTPPASGRGPVALTFDKSLDRALVERMLTVVDASGKPVDVPVVSVANDPRRAAIGTSDTVWKPGSYTLTIDPRLEDVCGNRVGRAFDVDLARPAVGETKPVLALPFVVR